MLLLAQPASISTFAPFGQLIVPPDAPGERTFYTDWLGSEHPGTAPRLHVNFVPAVSLPHRVTVLERHPHAAQIFLPLEADRYFIVVAPSLSNGAPDLGNARAFVAPGNIGVIYSKGTWHASATALGRSAHFAVFMWRNDGDDDEFLTLDSPLTVDL